MTPVSLNSSRITKLLNAHQTWFYCFVWLTCSLCLTRPLAIVIRSLRVFNIRVFRHTIHSLLLASHSALACCFKSDPDTAATCYTYVPCVYARVCMCAAHSSLMRYNVHVLRALCASVRAVRNVLVCVCVCVGCERCVLSRVLSAAVRAYSPYLSLRSAADSAVPLALCKKRLTCHRHHCRSCIGFARSAAALLALSTPYTSAMSAMYCKLSLFNYSAVDVV